MTSSYGRLVQEYRTNFPHETVPSWCALREDGSYGGASTAPPSYPGGGIDLVTAAGASRVVALRMAKTVDLTAIKVLEMQIVMTGGGDSTTAVFIGARDIDATRGGGVARNANNSTVYLRGYAPGQTNKDTTFQAWSGVGLRQSIGYRLFPNEVRGGVAVRVSQLLLDGEIFAERTFTVAEFPLDLPVSGEFFVAGSSGSAGSIARTIHSFEYREYLR